jgi:hypothetical protein
MRYLCLLVALVGCSRNGAPAARLATAVPASGATVAAGDGRFEVEFPPGTFPDGATVDVEGVPLDDALRALLQPLLDLLDPDWEVVAVYRVEADADAQASPGYRYRIDAPVRVENGIQMVDAPLHLTGEMDIGASLAGGGGGAGGEPRLEAGEQLVVGPDGTFQVEGATEPPARDTPKYIVIIETPVVFEPHVPASARPGPMEGEVEVRWKNGPLEARPGNDLFPEGYWEMVSPNTDGVVVPADAPPGEQTFSAGEWDACPDGEAGLVGGTVVFTFDGIPGVLEYRFEVACEAPAETRSFRAFCHDAPTGIHKVHPLISELGVLVGEQSFLTAGDGVRGWIRDDGSVIHCEPDAFVGLVTTNSVAIASQNPDGSLLEVAFLTAGSGALLRNVIDNQDGERLFTQFLFNRETTDVSIVGNDPLSGQAVAVPGFISFFAVTGVDDPQPTSILLDQFPEDSGVPVTATRKRNGPLLSVTDLGFIVKFDFQGLNEGTAIGTAGTTPRYIRYCGDFAFVTNEGSDNVTVIRWTDTACAVVGTFPVGDGPGHIALRKVDTLLGERIAVLTTGRFDDTFRVTLVDPATGAVTSEQVFNAPDGFREPVGCTWCSDTEFVVSFRETANMLVQGWTP